MAATLDTAPAPASRRRATRRPTSRRRPIGTRIALYTGVLLFAGTVLWPILYTFGASLSPAHAGQSAWDNFHAIFGGKISTEGTGGSQSARGLLGAIGHSLIVSVALVVIDLVVAGLAAYGLSRYRFRGSRFFYMTLVATRVVPALAIVGPYFTFFNNAGLFNTVWALIISYNAFTLPLAIMVLKNYFDELPRSIEEAALVDGASRFRAYWMIVVPLARPGLAAAGVLIFLEAWSEFFYALVLTNELTVTPLLSSFQSAQQFNWNALAAASVIAMIPPIVLGIAFQKNVVGALVAGFEK